MKTNIVPCYSPKQDGYFLLNKTTNEIANFGVIPTRTHRRKILADVRQHPSVYKWMKNEPILELRELAGSIG